MSNIQRTALLRKIDGDGLSVSLDTAVAVFPLRVSIVVNCSMREMAFPCRTSGKRLWKCSVRGVKVAT